MTKDSLIDFLKGNNITIHRDSRGPTGHINGIRLMIVSYKASNESRILAILKEKKHKNFSFYKIFGDMVRFASW